MRHSAILAAALLLLACNKGNDRVSDTAAGSLTPADSAMDTTGGMRHDSGMTRTGADTNATPGGTASAGARNATAGGGATAGTATNQTQSGVTNAKTGKSTLGPGVKQLEPTGGRTTVNAEQGVVRDTLRVKKTP